MKRPIIAQNVGIVVLLILISASYLGWRYAESLKDKKLPEDIAILRKGDIWVTHKNLAKEKITRSGDIESYAFSPDGKEVYWLNQKGELWKKNAKTLVPLAGVPDAIEYKKYRINLEAYRKDYEKNCGDISKALDDKEIVRIGKVYNFQLSPDGEYILYEIYKAFDLEYYLGQHLRFIRLWIMKKDGTEKVEISFPDVPSYIIHFDGWFPDSKKILFHYTYPDSPITGEPFYWVGLDGKNPQIYTGIQVILSWGDTVTTAGAAPVFSPLGDKMVYQKGGIFGKEIWIANIDGSEQRYISEIRLEGNDYFNWKWEWAEDGSLLFLKGDRDRTYIVTKEGEVIYSFKEGTIVTRALLSPDRKYVAGVYKKKAEGIDTIFFIDLNTMEKKDFTPPKLVLPPKEIELYPQFFSKNKRLYYLINMEQLWSIDSQGKNYIVAKGLYTMGVIKTKKRVAAIPEIKLARPGNSLRPAKISVK